MIRIGRYIVGLAIFAGIAFGVAELQAEITRVSGGGVGGVSSSRTISAGGDLTGGGDLSANRTITLPDSLTPKTISASVAATFPLTIEKNLAATGSNQVLEVTRQGTSRHRIALDAVDRMTFSAQSGAGGYILSSASANGEIRTDDTIGTQIQYTGNQRVTCDGSNVTLRGGGAIVVQIGSNTLGLYGSTPAAQGAVGTTLVNSVTSGGTTGQIDDFAASSYATDAATIRNDIYQLALKVSTLEAKLKLLGAVKD